MTLDEKLVKAEQKASKRIGTIRTHQSNVMFFASSGTFGGDLSPHKAKRISSFLSQLAE
jgi:hypothetical protein